MDWLQILFAALSLIMTAFLFILNVRMKKAERREEYQKQQNALMLQGNLIYGRALLEAGRAIQTSKSNGGLSKSLERVEEHTDALLDHLTEK